MPNDTFGDHHIVIYDLVGDTSRYDPNFEDVQQRLNNGETPIEIYESDNSLLNTIKGAKYQGGIIFYLNVNTGNGLVVSEYDISEKYFGCTNDPLSVNTEKVIGSGLSNSNTIITNCGNFNAAGACINSNLNGYTDWYLPSVNELLEIRKLYEDSKRIYLEWNEYYISSSYDYFDDDYQWVYTILRSHDEEQAIGIDRVARVRAVRSF